MHGIAERHNNLVLYSSRRSKALGTACRVLAREPEAAEIRMYQPGHMNAQGENCHNASTMRKGISHPRGKKARQAQVHPSLLEMHWQVFLTL